jgi:hypothetical protein
MIRYRYNRQVKPPAPFVYVTLRCPETRKAVANLPAQLDIAADRTVIPASLVVPLGMSPVDELQVAGLGGRVFSVPAYLVELTLHTLSPQEVVVLAQDGEPFILLGRDVLNRHRLLLDGPGLALEID